MHARKTRLPARPRVRVRAREEPVNPSRPETISPGKRLFSPGRPGFLGLFAPVHRPTAAFFDPVAAFYAKKSPGKPRPGVLFSPISPAFSPDLRPVTPAHRPGSRSGVRFSARWIGFLPRQRPAPPDLFPGNAAHRPAFCPGDPGFARPGTPARLPRPGHPGLRPAPTQTSPLRCSEVPCDPQGASDPWPHRLETAAQVRVIFREIGTPGV